jgi:hypothetical protein
MLLLRLLTPPSIPIEADCLAPDRLLGKSTGEVAALTVLHGNTAVRSAIFFTSAAIRPMVPSSLRGTVPA